MCITLNPYVFGLETMAHNQLSKLEKESQTGLTFSKSDKSRWVALNTATKVLGYIPGMGLLLNIAGLFAGRFQEEGSEKNQRIIRGIVESLGLGILLLPIDAGLLIKNSYQS